MLTASNRVIDYELQTAAFRAQAAGGGPAPNAARSVRPPIPQYIHDRTSPVNVPTVQFATPGAASTALVIGGRAVDDGSQPISAIALQTVLYVLNVNASGIIGQEAAREFYEHSQRWTNNYDVGQVMSTKAVRCIDDQIHTDQDYPYPEETRKVWLQTFTVPQVAALVLRYFRADTQLGQSLAEHFSKVHLTFCYNKREIVMRCMTQFREVVENHVQVHGTLSTSDHATLTLILEKKMPLNGAITAKYKEHKRVNPHDVDDWEFAMRRFFSQVNAVRQLQLRVADFGNPNEIYCHPARYNPYGLSLTTNPKTLLVGAALPSLPLLPLPTTPYPQCKSCGHRDHAFKNCPHMWMVDSNTDHNVPRDHSNISRTWAQYGHATYPLHDRIPGLGRFKIQIPRRETNSTDDVLKISQPPGGGVIKRSTKGTPIMGNFNRNNTNKPRYGPGGNSTTSANNTTINAASSGPPLPAPYDGTLVHTVANDELVVAMHVNTCSPTDTPSSLCMLDSDVHLRDAFEVANTSTDLLDNTNDVIPTCLNVLQPPHTSLPLISGVLAACHSHTDMSEIPLTGTLPPDSIVAAVHSTKPDELLSLLVFKDERRTLQGHAPTITASSPQSTGLHLAAHAL